MKKYFPLIIAALSLTGCFTNGRVAPVTKGAATAAVTTPSPTPTGPFAIASVVVDKPAQDGGIGNTRIFIDTAQQAANKLGPITNYCSTGQGGTACICRFNWTEVNANSPYTVQIPRQVDTAFSKIQAAVVECPTPEKYFQEVPDGTPVTITLMPLNPGSTVFATPAFGFSKGSTAGVGGNFADAKGHSFENIFHYTCHDQTQKALVVKNRISNRNIQVQNAQGQVQNIPVAIPIATDFCTAKAGQQPPQGCEGIENTFDYTSQAYYYNLYTRDGDLGNINSSNARYVCPKVNEPLVKDNSVASRSQFWPLDETFALSLGKNADFPIGVDAYTRLAYAGDPVSQASACDQAPGAQTGTASFDTLSRGCLGFAARPKSDGSCGTFKDSTGVIRPMFRLRRYTALLPQFFDADGSPLIQSQITDSVYVLDRPVNSGDPQKPYSMLGPKPCPISFFDNGGPNNTALANGRAGIVAGFAARNYSRRYVGSNDPDWNTFDATGAITGSVNIDGTEFPNTDTQTSCAAAIGLVSPDKSQITVGTITAANPRADLKRKFIRPYKPWSLHYEEDTDFQACAPQPIQINSAVTPATSSVVVRDPPLHFQVDGAGQMTYCAEVYPTQNPNIARIDPPTGTAGATTPGGNALLFTSHAVKGVNVVSVPACTPTVPANVTGNANYSQTGLLLHNAGVTQTLQDQALLDLGNGITQTCDRTTLLTNPTFAKFPLLAPAKNVEAALTADPSFRCTITFDYGTGLAGNRVPSGGCCGPAVNGANAHLEPGLGGVTDCQTPAK